MSPSTLRKQFFPRERLEVDFRNRIKSRFEKKRVLFPESLDGLTTDTVIRYRGQECILLLLIVRTENDVLIEEGLIGWIETGKRSRQVHAHQQRVPVAELRSEQRHGGQHEVAA